LAIPKNSTSSDSTSTFFSTSTIFWCVKRLTRVSSIAEYFSFPFRPSSIWP
jgi:hypothetical protein